MYNNINGYQSKAERFQEIIEETEPDIIIVLETKVGKQNTVNKDLKNYNIINKYVKKGQGGILCGVKQNSGATSVLEVTTAHDRY